MPPNLPMKQPTAKQREILSLADQGLPITDIAEKLGLSRTSVRLQILRIRKKVKRGDFTPALLPIEIVAGGHAPP